MEHSENKDITEQYNEFKDSSRLLRDKERSMRIRAQNKEFLIKFSLNSIIVILILIIIFRPILKSTSNYIKENLTYNIMTKINYHFNGNFEIISPKIDVKQAVTPDVCYKIKDQNGIVFSVKKDKTMITTDYSEHLYRMYVLDYITEKNIDYIKYEGTENVTSDGTFFVFSYGLKLDGYEQIEKEINDKVLSLIKYMENRAKKDFAFEAINFNTYVYINNFSTQVYYYEYNLYGEECVLNKIKIDYMNYLFDNNLIDESIPQEDIEKYHRPRTLSMYINSSTKQDEISYNYGKMDYGVDIYKIIDSSNKIETIKNDITQKTTGFTYNGKEYYIDTELSFTIKGSKIPSYWTIKMVQDFFGADIKYDYYNKTINIDF